jgi:hypothetical protein
VRESLYLIAATDKMSQPKHLQKACTTAAWPTSLLENGDESMCAAMERNGSS